MDRPGEFEVSTMTPEEGLELLRRVVHKFENHETKRANASIAQAVRLVLELVGG
jgi:hypothetical protein